MGRIDKVEKGARDAGFLEADEAAIALGLARSGQPVVPGKGPSLKAMLNRFAILATDRRVHAFRLGQAGFKSVKEEAFSAPYEELEAERIKGSGYLEVRRKGERDMWLFSPIPYGSRFKELEQHCTSRGVPPMTREWDRDD